MYCLIALMFVSLSTGCASKYGPQQTKVEYYPACYDPIKKLRNDEHSVATGTAAGVGLGAAGGALLGFFATGKVEGAIAGGLAGGLAGGVIGNQIAKNRKIADENKRMAAYLNDINGSINNLDIQSASAKAALECYDQQFKILLTSIKKKKVSREEAQRMFNEIQAGTREATSILGALEADAKDIERQYRAALATEDQELQNNVKNRNKSQIRATRKELRKAQKSCDSLQANTQKISNQRSAAEQQMAVRQTALAAELKASFDEADA